MQETKNLQLDFTVGIPLRYGENPHQNAFFCKDPNCTEASIANAEQLHGKELSYNNIVDADAALEIIREFADENAIAIIKHLNPCGLATGETLSIAMKHAWEGDPVSAFGSVIASSKKIDLATAEFLKGKFVEILLAPDFDDDALEFLKNKSKDIRLLKVGEIEKPKAGKVYKHVIGGLLVQDRDIECWQKFDCVTDAKFPQEQETLAKFTWLACKHTKSNAIVLGFEYDYGYYMVIGLGPGQPNRIDSTNKLCVPRAADNIIRMGLGNEAWGELVLASDAFFPFPDNVEAAHNAGIKYIVQPGGSVKDGESIAKCNEFGIAMAFTGMRHFRH